MGPPWSETFAYWDGYPHPWLRKKNDPHPPRFYNVSPFAEAYLGVEVHREGRGDELRFPLGKVPEEEDAEHVQKCHPGDRADLRVWWPGNKGRRVTAGRDHPCKSLPRSSHLFTWGSVGTGAVASKSWAPVCFSFPSSLM